MQSPFLRGVQKITARAMANGCPIKIYYHTLLCSCVLIYLVLKNSSMISIAASGSNPG